jgi:hypothetical protein
MWPSQSVAARAAQVVAVAFLFGVSGCGKNEPKFHEVKGKVELPDGDVRVLAGSSVEGALESDTTVRAGGVIKEDGSFTLETLHQGVIKKGAREGTYQVRIILDDEDRQLRRKAKQALHSRYFSFQDSGLTFQVPANGTVTLKLSAK